MGAGGPGPCAAAIALVGLALSLLGAPIAHARSDFFGVNPGPPPDHADYPAISATNVKTVRFLLPWMVIEKNRGERDWADTDELVGGLASNGLRPVPFAFGSPSWTRAGGFAHPPLNTKSARLGWESFLKAAVRRYGPGGSYWKAPYHQQFGSGATPWPITSWQIWNEPNPRWNFAPGTTVKQAAQLYARLVHLSHDAIRSVDRRAEIVTAGFITQKDPYVYEFLRDFYSVPGIKDDFDTLAQHAYAPTVDQVRTAIKRVRDVMAKHNDRATPMWITELGWGSDPPDGEGINLGPEGQADMLTRTFNLILAHRSAWNVQRLYWFDWRDPAPGSHYAEICGRCGSAGLTSYDRAPKPAYEAFLSFAAETTPPLVSITAGPADGARINDVTPSFSLASSEVGSSFACRIDGGHYKPCGSPHTTPRLADGTHTFRARAIDAAGNQSAPVSRSFTVDSRPPPAPRIDLVSPKSPANNNNPRLSGSAQAGSTVRLYKTGACTGAPARTSPAAKFGSQGITVQVADNTSDSFRAAAVDAAGNASACSSARVYIEDSIAPQTTITGGPSGTTTDSTPTFAFIANEAQSTFRCRFDSRPYGPCSGPGQRHTPPTPLAGGPHTFSVRALDRAQNADRTAAQRSFTVTP
jgi:Glycosyl hydrolase catalytic core